MAGRREEPPGEETEQPAGQDTGQPALEDTDRPAGGHAEPPLPPDPEAYDSPRSSQARARGLAAPYIAGGNDPDPEAGRREERRYLRILIVMVVVIVLSGFVLGYIAQLLGFSA